jgi:curved DNA-binding protein CbpA
MDSNINDMDKIFNKISSEVLNNKKTKKDTNKDSKKDNINIKFDYYKILGVKSDASRVDIKRAYKKLLAKYHPDRVEKTKYNKSKYKLIKEAGRILTDERKRKVYDFDKKNSQENSDFFGQRDNFKSFIELQESEMNEEDRKISKLKYDQFMNDKINSHGYNAEDEGVIDPDNYRERFDDMLKSREMNELEFDHKNIFEGRQFNQKEFNKMFEKKTKRNKKSKKSNDKLSKVDDIVGWNCDDNYANIDNDNLYNQDDDFTGTTDYANIDNGLFDFEKYQNDDSDNDSDSDDNSELDSDIDDNKIPQDDFDKMMNDALNSRKKEDTGFENMTDVDFKSALDNKDSISSKFGFMIGDSAVTKGDQGKTKLKYSEDLADAYKELTQE